ncbi:MAG: YkvA family protein [Shewanella sp.]|uniref:YkvA family protein n=2 Tax=Shewanella sp. TaxID=50422 RepID=UPI003F412896
MADEQFTEAGFWNKIKLFGRQAGREVVERALWLYYAAQKPNTPTWAKSVILGALAYFISPLDAIPDLTPLLGFSDDLGALAAALTMVSLYIDDEVKALAADKLTTWFGHDPAEPKA